MSLQVRHAVAARSARELLHARPAGSACACAGRSAILFESAPLNRIAAAGCNRRASALKSEVGTGTVALVLEVTPVEALENDDGQ